MSEYFATWSRSYQTLIFPVFQFSLLHLRVCSKGKKCVYYTMANLSSKKQKNSSFPKKKNLVGLNPEQKNWNFFFSFSQVSLSDGKIPTFWQFSCEAILEQKQVLCQNQIKLKFIRWSRFYQTFFVPANRKIKVHIS